MDITVLPGSIEFMESGLEVAIMEHTALNMLSVYEQMVYMEADDSDDTPASEGFFAKIKQAIKNILDRIHSVITGFFDSLKIGSKKRITADLFMDSETGQYEMQCKVDEMMKAIDDEYLKARKVVSGLSKVTGIDPNYVAEIVDNVDSTLHDNRYLIAHSAKRVVKQQVVNKLRLTISDRLGYLDKMRGEVESGLSAEEKKLLKQGRAAKSLRDREKAEREAAHAAKNELLAQKKGGAVLVATSKAIHKLTNAYLFLARQVKPKNVLDKAIKDSIKEAKPIEKRVDKQAKNRNLSTS